MPLPESFRQGHYQRGGKTMNRTYCNSPEDILRLAASNEVYARALQKAKETDAFWRTSFQDDPGRLSGWFHNFVCPDCAMAFRQDYTWRPGRAFVCPNCGAEASGRDLDEAWVYGYRYEAVLALTSSALMYHVYGEKKSLDYIIRFLDFYADAYDTFPVHGAHAGKGKIMGQSLDEAVWAAAALRALSVCGRENIPVGKLTAWRDRLFLPLADLVGRQANMIHNIPLWLQAARGLIALFFEDEALLRDALESEFGIRNQARQGYTADGLWYELSLGYHYYATEALGEFVAAYACVCPQDELIELLRRAYQTPGQLSPDGWSLPCINDMSYPSRIASRSRPGLRAYRIAPSRELALQIREGMCREPERLEGAETLLYMPPDVPEGIEFNPPERKVFPASCLAVMNKPMNIVLKSGSLTKSHMHSDALSVGVYPFSNDIGNPGYGHPMCQAYYRTSLAHNTVLMDGRSQPFRAQRQRVYETPAGIAARVEDLFDGVMGQRTLTAHGTSVTDVTEITADKTHQFDWIFHSEGEAALPAGGRPSELKGDEASYTYLTDIMEYDAKDGFKASFTLNGQVLEVLIPSETACQSRVFTAHMPGNPANTTMTAVIVRAHGAQIRFEARYEVINNG